MEHRGSLEEVMSWIDDLTRSQGLPRPLETSTKQRLLLKTIVNEPRLLAVLPDHLQRDIVAAATMLGLVDKTQQ
jgi:ABC-type ATPase involved in cell division